MNTNRSVYFVTLVYGKSSVGVWSKLVKLCIKMILTLKSPLLLLVSIQEAACLHFTKLERVVLVHIGCRDNEFVEVVCLARMGLF